MASGSVCIPPRSAHCVQRSSRARRTNADVAPRGRPGGTQRWRCLGVSPLRPHTGPLRLPIGVSFLCVPTWDPSVSPYITCLCPHVP